MIDGAALCAAYDQISDRTCRFYANHGGAHNFARLGHDSSLERELRRELDALKRDTLDELDKLQKDVAELETKVAKTHAEDQSSLLKSAESELHRELNDLQNGFAKALTESQTSLEEAVRLVDSEWHARLTEALDLFDAGWCTEHGHAPKPEMFERIATLRRLVRV